MSDLIKPPTILVIDDDAEVRYSLGRVLSSKKYQVGEAASGELGVAAVKKGPFPDLIFLDIRMSGMSGIEALQHIRSVNPKQLVVLMTAFGTAQTAIEAMKYGAFDYIMKPFDPAKVLTIAENALKAHADMRAVVDYKPTINSDDYKEGIVGSSPVMQDVFKIIGQITASDVTVMITGESGTGKELVARSIWKHSHRASKPFIAVNCAAIPDNLIESELFGHEKGSFTGATGQRLGKFELCDGGTIFLDEIGDMALATQTKILRVLQQGEIQRVGGTDTIRVDVRILAATNKDLEEMVKAKTFREDLYYRLNVVRIRMPALRERVDDVPQILDFGLQNLLKQKKTRVSKVSPEALAVLTRYRWPGNVRELENVVYRSAVIAQGDTILLKDLPIEVREAAGIVPLQGYAPQTSGGAGGGAGYSGGTGAGGGAGAGGNANTHGGDGHVPFENARMHSAESATLANAQILAESIASGASGGGVNAGGGVGSGAGGPGSGTGVAGNEGPLTVERALDFLHVELSQSPEPILERFEREMIIRVLAATEGNLLKASERLGMTRATLRKRVDDLGLKT